MATAIKRDIDLGMRRLEYGDPGRVRVAVLEIETCKHYNGGLRSECQVYWEGDHSRQCIMSVGGDTDGDYCKCVFISAKTVKATQKAIERQHAEVFTPEVVERLTQAAKDHYAAIVRAGVDGFKNVYLAEVAK